MTIIGVDKNGDEIAEVSVSELDTMFKEIRNKAIDDFAEKVKEIYPFTILELEELDKVAEQLKADKGE